MGVRFRIPGMKPTRRPRVRPWALSAPVIVLLIACPLPLIRLQRLAELSDNEKSRLATVEALVDHGTFAINQSRPDFASTRDRIEIFDRSAGATHSGRPAILHYSKQPPVPAFLLAGPYWALQKGWGLRFADPQDTMKLIYLLTLLTAALPAAGVAALVYRMGRVFELPRPLRAGLALVTVCGSGLISYSTALNSHAPAAALVMAACACLLHVVIAERPSRTGNWLVTAGFCAALAAVIDMAALLFLILLLPVVLAMRWPTSHRIGGLAMFVLGALPPLALHCVLTIGITGDVRPGFLHPELDARWRPVAAATVANDPAAEEDEEPTGPSALSRRIGHFLDGTIGAHGLLSHFPVVIFGVIGVTYVVRRHWPVATKMLAIATVLTGVGIVGGYLVLDPDWTQPMFAVRWFVIFLPLLLFWGGAWLRRTHHPATWAVAAVLLVFSTAVSLIGATGPFVPNPTGQYTAFAAANRLFGPAAPAHPGPDDTPALHPASLARPQVADGN